MTQIIERKERMRRILFLALVLAFCAALPAMALGSWDAVADFSHTQNPNGAWAYGTSGNLTSYNFVVSPSAYELTPFSPVYAGVWGWDWRTPAVADFLCSVAVNNLDHDTLWIPAGTIAGHPGLGPAYSVIRWTAPTDGMFQIATRVFTTDANPYDFNDLDIAVLVNGVAIPESVQFCGIVHGREGIYNGSLSLTAGTTVDLAIGPNGDITSDAWLATYTVTEVVPEPASFAAMATGLIALLGFARRRRT